MASTWYFLIAFMLTTYAVLDGFDFGAGILHLFVAKTDAERRAVLAAIGPVWDGNGNDSMSIQSTGRVRTRRPLHSTSAAPPRTANSRVPSPTITWYA